MSHTQTVELVPNQGWDERILVCRNGKLVDVFIIITERYVVLVDTLINGATAEKLMQFAKPHLVNGRSLLVINSHADYDHAWGNQLFAGPNAPYPAPIIAHERCAEEFAVWAADLVTMRDKEPDVFGDVVLTPPTLLFNGRFTIHGGDLTLQLIPTFGHTRDHVSVYIPEIRTLLAADAAEQPYPMPRHPSGMGDMRQSLAQLAALEAETVLYCHAPVTIGGKLLHDNIAYFDALETACRRALAAGILPETLSDDDDLAALVGCTFAQAMPPNFDPATVHPYYAGKGHNGQIRAMVEWLLEIGD
ncbi:MAG: MBL fold metallo-hydrolase [Anaerolineales bacterium]|nr:MBL fold metallo-hydrolase [Anaerolineales bacterium]